MTVSGRRSNGTLTTYPDPAFREERLRVLLALSRRPTSLRTLEARLGLPRPRLARRLRELCSLRYARLAPHGFTLTLDGERRQGEVA